MKCPFIMQCSCPGVEDKSLFPIFRKVHITQCNPRRICTQCSSAFRIAGNMFKSTMQVNLKLSSNVLQIIEFNSFISAGHPRPILQECIPEYINIPAGFIKNFRRRYQLYHATHGDVFSLNTITLFC